jgi:hypothetical protein
LASSDDGLALANSGEGDKEVSFSEFPPHIPNRIRYSLHRFANNMRALFDGPVYLVGTYLREGNTNPRDIDLRIRLTDEDFLLRYKPSKWSPDPEQLLIREAELLSSFKLCRDSGMFTLVYWNWVRDMHKYSRAGRIQCERNIDLQVYPESYWKEFDGQPRVRLDSYMIDDYEPKA